MKLLFVLVLVGLIAGIVTLALSLPAWVSSGLGGLLGALVTVRWLRTRKAWHFER